MTSKLNSILSLWARSLLGLFVALALAFAAPAQTEQPAAPAVATETVALPNALPEKATQVERQQDPPEAPAPAREKPRRQKLNPIVAISGNGTVNEGETTEDVVVIRGDADIRGDVRGDVVVLFGKLRLTGDVDGDVIVVLGEAEINGRIDGDLTLVMSPSHLGSRTDVRGSAVAVGSAPEREAGARLRHPPQIIQMEPLMRSLNWAKDYLFEGVLLFRPFPPRLAWVWAVAGGFLVFHLLLAVLFANPLRGCMETLRLQPTRSFLIGLLACILVGPLAVLVSFTVVATPLIMLGFLALCVFGRLAVYAASGAAVGRASGSESLTHPLPAVVVGSALFYASYMVPVMGFLVYWLLLPWGVGAALIRVFDALGRERRPPSVGRVSEGPGSAPFASASTLTSGASGPATQALVTESEAGVGEGGPTASVAGAPPVAERAIPVPPLVPLSPIDLSALPRVGFWPRFGATLIDVLIVGFINAMLFHHARSFWLLLGLYHFLFWGWRGTTLGGSILQLRVIRLDGRPVDWATAAVRVLGSIVSLLALGVGFFWASWDDQVQSWHDRIAGTTIVKSRARSSLV